MAAFMELALYDPALGYYASAAQRSGRAGDFFTSVDVGPVFGELLEIQLAEMADLLSGLRPQTSGVGPQVSALRSQTTSHWRHAPNASPEAGGPQPEAGFDLVEAGAGNGRLSADILRAARIRDPDFYSRIRLHLVDASRAARDAQMATLADVGDRPSTSSATLPDAFEGVLVANELLDAFPVHQVVMRQHGLREVYVVPDTVSDEVPDTVSDEVSDAVPDTVSGTAPDTAPDTVPDTGLNLREGPLSTVALIEYFDRLGVALEPGWRAEINLRAVDWIRDAARRLRRGFIILIDYGHEARELYSVTHAGGTLTTFAGHRRWGPEADANAPAWLQRPGEQDLTAHVDFTSVRNAAEAEGLTTLAFLDQTYFLLGLVGGWSAMALAERSAALKTLLIPGGLGSTHKVMIFGKGVGTPALQGCSFRMRVT